MQKNSENFVGKTSCKSSDYTNTLQKRARVDNTLWIFHLEREDNKTALPRPIGTSAVQDWYETDFVETYAPLAVNADKARYRIRNVPQMNPVN